MSDDIKIDLNPNLEQMISQMPEVGQRTEALTKAIASTARTNAPVETGAYQAGIRVEKSSKPKSGAWRVFAADWKSSIIEFGNPNQGRKGYFNIRRAAEQTGATFLPPKSKKSR